MALEGLEGVPEEDLVRALMSLREFRAWGVREDIDPWAIRQALIMVLAMDTEAALERGVDPDTLFTFDEEAETKAGEFIESIPEELKSQVLQERGQ